MIVSTQRASTTPVPTEDFISTIIDSIQDIKGKCITKIDLREVDDAPVDYFIICEGESNTQVRGISDRVQKRTKEEFGIAPNHNEGKSYARWILLDYFDVVVHIFHPETRALYDLEDLWSDGVQTVYDNLY